MPELPADPARRELSVPIGHLSRAIDEIYALRGTAAEVVEFLDDMLKIKSLSKMRRRQLTACRDVLADAAQGLSEQRGGLSVRNRRKAALRGLGLDDCLTNSQWLEEKGLTS